MKKILFFVLPLVFMCSYSFAKVKNEDITSFVENISKEFTKINNSNCTKELKLTEYKNFTSKIIYSQWMARFILGSHWRELNSDQRKKFHDLYKEYLILNYMTKLQGFSFDLKVNKIEPQNNTAYLVYCTTKDQDNKNINVNFRLETKNDNILITDIIPEGISFISSQRTEVDSAITRMSYKEFIKDLKKKVDDLNKQN